MALSGAKPDIYNRHCPHVWDLTRHTNPNRMPRHLVCCRSPPPGWNSESTFGWLAPPSLLCCVEVHANYIKPSWMDTSRSLLEPSVTAPFFADLNSQSSTVWNPKNSQNIWAFSFIPHFLLNCCLAMLSTCWAHAEHTRSSQVPRLGFILNRSRFGSTLIHLAVWILRTAVPYMYM